jgi:large conductance mechanosensitive channel
MKIRAEQKLVGGSRSTGGLPARRVTKKPGPQTRTFDYDGGDRIEIRNQRGRTSARRRRQAAQTLLPLKPFSHDLLRRKPRMSMIQEFKSFALKGNVMDLAVGVIIGGAFSTIVNSIVKDLIMPVVGLVTGGLDFSNMFVRLGEIPPTFKGNPGSYKDLQTAGVAVFGYGSFITVLINFIILAFIIFLMVKFINKLRRADDAAPAEPAPTPEEVLLLREIRDSLQGAPRV